MTSQIPAGEETAQKWEVAGIWWKQGSEEIEKEQEQDDLPVLDLITNYSSRPKTYDWNIVNTISNIQESQHNRIYLQVTQITTVTLALARCVSRCRCRYWCSR